MNSGPSDSKLRDFRNSNTYNLVAGKKGDAAGLRLSPTLHVERFYFKLVDARGFRVCLHEMMWLTLHQANDHFSAGILVTRSSCPLSLKDSAHFKRGRLKGELVIVVLRTILRSLYTRLRISRQHPR